MQFGHCKQYNGMVFHRDNCNAGVNVRALVGGEDFGWLKRIPCFTEHRSPVECSLYEEPTQQEINAHEEEIDAAMQRMMLVLPVIREVKSAFKGKNWSGSRTCPVCSGVLHLSISSCNGHVHGRCETSGCVHWME